MGVTIFVNSPADTTNDQTTSNKLYPYDFTNQVRKPRAFKMIARVRDIMNSIQGPKIMDINISSSNDINRISTLDGAHKWLSDTFVESDLPQTVGFASNYNITLVNKDKLYVRRDGENANAITAIDFMTANYNEQASRITSNAPSNSMYSYPFVFSNYTLDPTLRPLCIAPILRWYWVNFTATTGEQVHVLPISKLNTNIQSNTVFPGALVPFPDNAVVVDCSSLSTNTIGKLYKLSPYIIDVSNTYEGNYASVSSYDLDSDIALALDHTYSSQDIEFALFLGSLYLPNQTVSNTITIPIHTYKYDPVEAIFSYFSTRKYEFTDNPLNNISLNVTFKRNIILSNRIAITYLMQQAAKQMHIWLTPEIAITKGSYTINQINESLKFNNDMDLTVSQAGAYVHFPMWIPYEYVKSSNNNVELDRPSWVSGRGNRKIAKHVVKPRSYYTSEDVIYYYNKFGESFGYDAENSAFPPVSIYVPNLPDRCVYTAQTWNDDNLLCDDYLEESDYFPVPDLETNI